MLKYNKTQLKWLNQSKEGKINLILTSRQSGKSFFIKKLSSEILTYEKKNIAIVLQRHNQIYEYKKEFSPETYNSIDFYSSFDTFKIKGKNYDMIFIDEFSYFHNQSIWLDLLKFYNAVSSTTVVILSSSNPGSVFNNLCKKYHKKFFQKFISWIMRKDNQINLIMTVVIPENSEEFKKSMGKTLYDIEFNCLLN